MSGQMNNQNTIFDTTLMDIKNTNTNVYTCSNNDFSILTIKSSSSATGWYPYTPFKCINYTYWASAGNSLGTGYNNTQWNSVQRTYDQFNNNYICGDWLEIQFPKNIGITSYTFNNSASNYSWLPYQWTLMGSFDYSNYNIIDKQSINSNIFMNNVYSNITFTPASTSGYPCIRWVFEKNSGGSFCEVDYLSFTYNSLSNTNYTSTSYNYGSIVNNGLTTFNGPVMFNSNINIRTSTLSVSNLQSVNSINNSTTAFDNNLQSAYVNTSAGINLSRVGQSNTGAQYTFSNVNNFGGTKNFVVSCSGYFNDSTLPWYPFWNGSSGANGAWASIGRDGVGYGCTV